MRIKSGRRSKTCYKRAIFTELQQITNYAKLIAKGQLSCWNKPFVDKVDLVHATPNYALERFPRGRETTGSLRDVTPIAPESAVTPGAWENFTAQSPADPDRSMQFFPQSGDEDVISGREANSPPPV